VEQVGPGRDVRRRACPFPAGQPCDDLLQEPAVAVRVGERGVGLIGAALRVAARLAAAVQVEDLADLSALFNQVGAGRVDVADGQDQPLDRTGPGPWSSLGRTRSSNLNGVG